MAKAYVTPTLVASGSVIRATLGGSETNQEGGTKKDFITGSVGYYL
jgi:hypothetical protein